MNYNECKVLCKVERSKEPIVTRVPLDEFTAMCGANFDYTFDGESKFYPYIFPKEVLNTEFNMLVVTGASGAGKSTMLKSLGEEYKFDDNKYDNEKAIVSCFKTPEEASFKLSAVGINSIPTWCRPRRVLSVGEGFRADVALNLESYSVFDEFTSTIDRNVAKSTCNGLQKYIRRMGLTNIVFCSCHKDYIPFLKPDIVIDLDDEKVYDCRGERVDSTQKVNDFRSSLRLIGTIKC